MPKPTRDERRFAARIYERPLKTADVSCGSMLSKKGEVRAATLGRSPADYARVSVELAERHLHRPVRTTVTHQSVA